MCIRDSSYMLPLVVASGLLIAIGNLMGGEVVTDLSKMTIPSALTSLGVLAVSYTHLPLFPALFLTSFLLFHHIF